MQLGALRVVASDVPCTTTHEHPDRADWQHPETAWLIEALETTDSDDPSLEPLYEAAIKDTIERFEATGSPDHHRRRTTEIPQFLDLLRPRSGEHRARRLQDSFCRRPHAADAPAHERAVPLQALCRRAIWTWPPRYAHVPLKQAVISPSALSLMYPADGLPGYAREAFIEDLLREHETEVRRCFEKGAHKVQIDFTEGRLAMKVDPSGELLASFIDLNNLALARFSAGGARKDRHSHLSRAATGIPRIALTSTMPPCCPACSNSMSGNFYMSLAGEKDRARVLEIIRTT